MLEHDLEEAQSRGFPKKPVHQLGRDILHKDAHRSMDPASRPGCLELHSNTSRHLFDLQGSFLFKYLAENYFYSVQLFL
jgi:hypothetical protein